MNKFYAFIWDLGEDWYRAMGFDLFAPVKFFWPGFAPWLFGKMIGVEGVVILKSVKEGDE